MFLMSICEDGGCMCLIACRKVSPLTNLVVLLWHNFETEETCQCGLCR